MRVYRDLVFVMGLLLFYSGFCDARVMEEVSLYKKVEFVDGHEFTLIERESGGMKEEKRLVDGLVVEPQEFVDKALQARSNEWQQQEQREKDRREREYQSRRRARFDIAKKLIRNMVEQIRKVARQMENYGLTSYFESVFSEQTFVDQQEFDQLLNNTLSEIDEFLLKSYEQMDDQAAHAMLEKVEAHHDKMQDFFCAVRDYAIKHSDDTKLLKNLFELVS